MRQSFLQYVDKVICAHYEDDFVVDHECRHGVVSGAAADLFKEVDVKTYREIVTKMFACNTRVG